jgi:hypothetical protein
MTALAPIGALAPLAPMAPMAALAPMAAMTAMAPMAAMPPIAAMAAGAALAGMTFVAPRAAAAAPMTTAATATTVAAAPDDTPPLHSDPPAGFSFQGTWDCKGSFQPSTRPHHSTYEGRGVFGGRWTELVETDIDPPGYVAHYLIGPDEAKHQVVELDANNAGYAIYTSGGWQDRTLVLTGTDTVSYKNPPRNRFVFDVQGPDRFTVRWEIDQGGDRWHPADVLNCRKQAGAAHP